MSSKYFSFLLCFSMFFSLVAVSINTVAIRDNLFSVNEKEIVTSKRYPLPFSGLYINYSVNLVTYIQVGQQQIPLTIPINLNLKFSNQSIPLQFSNLGYDYEMKFSSSLKLGTSSFSENATLYVNKLNRKMALDVTKIEGIYISRFLDLIYNSSPNAINYVPFWVFPDEIKLHESYPVYSFNFTITNELTYDIEGFGNKNVWVAKMEENNLYVASSNTNVSHDFSVIYDQYTGVLLIGSLSSRFDFNNGTIREYSMDFNLNSTNAFSVFPPEPLSNSTDSGLQITLPKANTLLLFLSFTLPLILLAVSLFRIKKIKGGV